MTRNGQIRYELKTPYRNGTTHIIFEPLDFMYRMYGMPWAQGCTRTAISRLVALIPKPRQGEPLSPHISPAGNGPHHKQMNQLN